jgi:hypothetical protein
MAEIGWRKMEKPISGIHHVTAIASNPQESRFLHRGVGASPGQTHGQFRRSGNVPKDGEKKFLSLLIPMDPSWNWLLASGIGSRMHGAEN